MEIVSSLEHEYKVKEVLTLIKELDPLFNPPLSTRVDIAEYISKIDKRASLVLAYDNGNLVGMLIFYNNDTKNKQGYISLVAVLPKYHGQGIATNLLEHCIKLCQKNDMKTIKVKTERNNKVAIKLYRKKGFVVTNELATDNEWNSIFLLKKC